MVKISDRSKVSRRADLMSAMANQSVGCHETVSLK